MSRPRYPSDRADPIVVMMVAGALGGACLAGWLTAAPHANPDSFAFEALARNLRAGHGMVYREPMMPGLDLRAFRSPGYAAFLAATLGLGIPVVLALQGALAGLTAALIGSLAHRLAGARAGWIAFGSAALWWQPWRFAGELMTETLYALLMVLLVWRLAPAPVIARGHTVRVPAPDAGTAATAAVIGAFALFVRPGGVALAGAALAWLAARAPRAALVMAMVTLVAWAPWPARNARVLHAFVPSVTSGGLNAWNGNAGRPIGEGWRIQASEADRGELGLDRMFWRLTRDEARAHPGAVLRRLAVRVIGFVAPPAPDRWQWWLVVLWPLAGVAALHALLNGPPWRAAFALVALAWGMQGALAVATVMNDRYRYPTDWLVVLAGALGVDALMTRLGPRGGAAWAAALGFGTLGLTAALRALF